MAKPTAVLGTGQTRHRAKRTDVSMAGMIREAVDAAVKNPPETTRAKLRGDFITAAQAAGRDFTVDGFIEARNSLQGARTYDRMAASAAFRSMMVGVDRLDYSKGIPQRVRAFREQ